MEEVWRQGDSTVDDKGLLDRTRSGRSDTYTPTLSREEYQELRAAAQVRGLVDEFGDVALAHLAKSLQTLALPVLSVDARRN